MTSVFAARLGSALPLLEKSRRVPLIGFLLMSGFAWSPASAEPCPNEWNAYVQLGSASQRAQAQSWSDEYRYVIGTQTFDVNTEVYGTLGRREIWKNDPVSLRKAAQILIAQSARSQPVTGAQYRYGACRALARAAQLERGSGRPVKHSFPTPLPNIAAKPARPVTPSTLSPQQLRDNAIHARLMGVVTALKAKYPHIEGCAWRGVNEIQDPCVKHNSLQNIRVVDQVLAELEVVRRQVSVGYYSRSKDNWETLRSQNLGGCARLASSTTPCGLPVQGSVYGKKSRIIARDGRHALACVKLVSLSSGNSSTSGSGRVLSNQCGGPVEIAWCSMGGECQRGAGNSWTVQPGRSWPVEAQHEVRWGACHGANTIHGEEGSQGLNFTCSKPDK